MKLFWIFNGTKLKQYFVIVVAAVFAVGIAYAEKQNVSVFTSQTGPAAIYKVDTDQKKLALTFDISWGEQQVSPILEILEEKEVSKVTFFLSGEWTKEHPEIVKQIDELGYEIGSHGYKHINYSRLNDDEIKAQIRQADQILHEVVGKKPTLLRAPNGDIDKRVLKIATDLHYSVILWDTDSKDWLRPGVEEIVQNVVGKAHRGDIILFHASDSATQTHLALPEIIDHLRKDGYEFVTVTELITDAKVKAKPID
ncbi:polysaccharide deacetylase family sporulation protein PdaB [Ammoniphilus oxalaticus]|uniref:Polysaccharide deacetylase family sporulation protein PdaB n=1 Tax=Ammoniphilus oxalaticus TaxID=66863 RepID=A0A419SFV4_9BACL|nr:polysaccharide deacetylase family sporulation protein PdaB [Ammoniphilus oxalaticus]RKD22662.1 polysaccharide deacetylase family sporulation protein PdaB [Ammoniphilus oxalaticus]